MESWYKKANGFRLNLFAIDQLTTDKSIYPAVYYNKYV